MATVTALEVQKKNKERVNVYVDDAFFCGLSLDDVVRFRLAVGMNLSEMEMRSISDMGEENKYFTKALEYTLRSPKTQFQIKQYLYKKQLETPTINRIIDRLVALNYINDEQYAEQFVSAKSHKMGVGVIKQKLMQKGVNRDIVGESVAQVDNQEEPCLALAEKYMRNKEWTSENMAKLGRYLFSKGFAYDIIVSVKEKLRKE